MTTQEYLSQATAIGHDDRVSVEYSGVAHITPAELLRLTGVRADFSRPADAGPGDDPVSVVYTCHPLTGEYSRAKEMSWAGPCQLRGPLGGIRVPASEPIVFVVTR